MTGGFILIIIIGLTTMSIISGHINGSEIGERATVDH
jgi:hypothetical protein